MTKSDDDSDMMTRPDSEMTREKRDITLQIS